MGRGRVDLSAVTQITAMIDAHGSANLGFRQFSASKDNGTNDIAVTVQSVVASPVSYTVSVSPAVDGANAPVVTTSQTSFTVAGQGSMKFEVLLTVSPTTAQGDYFGDIVLSGGTVTLRVPYWVEITP